jgi:HAD superfamily hydrolase (TIGR01509 family)
VIAAGPKLEEIDLAGCELLVLDFDGVMTRLELDWRTLKADLSTECRTCWGLDVSFSPLESGRERVLQKLGREALDRLDDLIARRELAALESCRIETGAARLLERHTGRAALVSSNSRRVLAAALEKFGLAGRFEQVVGREDVTRCKPSPEGLLAVLRSARCEPSAALFVGDRDVDVRAGAAAGIPTVLVAPGEAARLEEIGSRHSYDEGFNGRMTRHRALRIREVVPAAGSLLDLGCGEGALAAALADHFRHVTAVDASALYIERARARLPEGACCTVSLIEEFHTVERFDCILMSGILEHALDPVGLLFRASGWLSAGGLLVVLVPNARSLHRRVGLAMGLLGEIGELQAHDHEVGHRRYYDREGLEQDVRRAGLRPRRIDGIMLKPLSNAQMEQWPDALADAFDEVGRQLPDWCAELLFVCERESSEA